MNLRPEIPHFEKGGRGIFCECLENLQIPLLSKADFEKIALKVMTLNICP